MFYCNFDEISLGSAPREESCAQLGFPDYHEQALIECRAFKKQLERQFEVPEELSGEIYFRIKHNPHDFGTYLSVEIRYNCDNEKALEFAIHVDNNVPNEWNEEARAYIESKMQAA